MGILDKIKVFSWAWRLLGQMDKLQTLLGKLDGYKSYLGLLGVVGYYGAEAYGVHPPEAILNASYGLLGVGLVHKLDKTTDIIKKVLPVLSTILSLFDKKKEENKNG